MWNAFRNRVSDHDRASSPCRRPTVGNPGVTPSGRTQLLEAKITDQFCWWRPRPELNRSKRFCRPLRNHSATWPSGGCRSSLQGRSGSGNPEGLRTRPGLSGTVRIIFSNASCLPHAWQGSALRAIESAKCDPIHRGALPVTVRSGHEPDRDQFRACQPNAPATARGQPARLHGEVMVGLTARRDPRVRGARCAQPDRRARQPAFSGRGTRRALRKRAGWRLFEKHEAALRRIKRLDRTRRRPK